MKRAGDRDAGEEKEALGEQGVDAEETAIAVMATATAAMAEVRERASARARGLRGRTQGDEEIEDISALLP